MQLAFSLLLTVKLCFNEMIEPFFKVPLICSLVRYFEQGRFIVCPVCSYLHIMFSYLLVPTFCNRKVLLFVGFLLAVSNSPTAVSFVQRRNMLQSCKFSCNLVFWNIGISFFHSFIHSRRPRVLWKYNRIAYSIHAMVT